MEGWPAIAGMIPLLPKTFDGIKMTLPHVRLQAADRPVVRDIQGVTDACYQAVEIEITVCLESVALPKCRVERGQEPQLRQAQSATHQGNG